MGKFIVVSGVSFIENSIPSQCKQARSLPRGSRKLARKERYHLPRARES